jgi:hypothetical protein
MRCARLEPGQDHGEAGSGAGIAESTFQPMRPRSLRLSHLRKSPPSPRRVPLTPTCAFPVPGRWHPIWRPQARQASLHGVYQLLGRGTRPPAPRRFEVFLLAKTLARGARLLRHQLERLAGDSSRPPLTEPPLNNPETKYDPERGPAGWEYPRMSQDRRFCRHRKMRAILTACCCS